MSVTNTLVYYAISTILMKKSFITLATVVEDETKNRLFAEPKSFSDSSIKSIKKLFSLSLIPGEPFCVV
jgi:hypothetical protein